jgi:predicted transcriptional regulator
MPDTTTDRAIGMKAICIRLDRSTIAAYKHLAKASGRPYQAIMRDAINAALVTLCAAEIQRAREAG